MQQTHEYNENGLLVKSRTNDGQEWIFDYDGNGNLIHHKGPGNEFWKEYDAMNREIRYKNNNVVVETSYDENGFATQTTFEPKP